MQEILEKIARVEESLAANALGLQNTYDEFKKYTFSNISDKIDRLNKRLDHYEKDKNVTDFGLEIQPYPFNIRINFIIKTNFGQIARVIDYPPALEYKLGNCIAYTYESLLNTLYEAHKQRGGKFIGEEGCQEWMDNNEKTIVNLEAQLASKCERKEEER